jgi:Lysylphosphatidylglycerol synthase TM region
LWLKIAYAVVAVVLFTAVELTVGWTRLLAPWAQASPLAILGAAMLILLTYAIRSARLYRFYDDCRDLAGCMRLFLLHNAFVNFLPVHSGEVSFPILMKRYFGIPTSRSVSGLLWLRYLDFHTLVLIGFAALWLATPWEWVLPVLLAWSVLPIATVFLWESLSRILDAHDNRISRVICDVLKTLPGSRPMLLESWGWTTLNWGVKLASFAWILTIFTPIDFADSMFGAAGGELSTVLPTNAPAGVGTYEAGVIAAVTPLGVRMHHAIIGGVNLHLFVLGMAVIGGLLTFLLPRPAKTHTVAAA